MWPRPLPNVGLSALTYMTEVGLGRTQALGPKWVAGYGPCRKCPRLQQTDTSIKSLFVSLTDLNQMACYIPASIPFFWATLGGVLRWCRGFWLVLLGQSMYASSRQVLWTVRPPKRPLHLFPSPRKFPLPLLLPLWPLRWTTLLRLSGGQPVFHAFKSYEGGKKQFNIITRIKSSLKMKWEDFIHVPGLISTVLYIGSCWPK